MHKSDKHHVQITEVGSWLYVEAQLLLKISSKVNLTDKRAKQAAHNPFLILQG